MCARAYNTVYSSLLFISFAFSIKLSRSVLRYTSTNEKARARAHHFRSSSSRRKNRRGINGKMKGSNKKKNYTNRKFLYGEKSGVYISGVFRSSFERKRALSLSLSLVLFHRRVRVCFLTVLFSLFFALLPSHSCSSNLCFLSVSQNFLLSSFLNYYT